MPNLDPMTSAEAGAPATTPGGVATSATHRFVRSHLPPPESGRVRLIEVGCGSGALAARLTADGYDVIALDSSEDAVRETRTAGVDARRAMWPEFDDDAANGARRFDAVMFVRSLHHLHPIGPALDRAKELLAPNALVLVEDFAFSEVDRATVAWFYGVLSLLDAAGALSHPAGELATRLLEGGGAFELWQADHDHEITPAAEMRAALDERFDVIADSREPYLYRYACPLLSADERGASIAARIYERERAIAAERVVRLIGRRYVARARD